MPILAKSGTLARLLGVPYVPLTANMLLLGPLGLLGYFPAKIRSGSSTRSLRRRPRPGALPPQPGVRRGRADPPAHAGRPLRHAAPPSQRVVRLDGGTPGPDHRVWRRSGGAGWPRPSRPIPDVDVIVGLDTDGARGWPSSGPSSSAPTRTTRSWPGWSRPPGSTPSSTPALVVDSTRDRRPSDPRAQRHRHHEPPRGRRRRPTARSRSRGGQVLDPGLRGLARATRTGSPSARQRVAPAADPHRAVAARGGELRRRLRRGQPPTCGWPPCASPTCSAPTSRPPLSTALTLPLVPRDRRLRSPAPVRRAARRGAGARSSPSTGSSRGATTWPAHGRLPWSEVSAMAGKLRPAAVPRSFTGLAVAPLGRLGPRPAPRGARPAALRAGRRRQPSCVRPGSRYTTRRRRCPAGLRRGRAAARRPSARPPRPTGTRATWRRSSGTPPPSSAPPEPGRSSQARLRRPARVTRLDPAPQVLVAPLRPVLGGDGVADVVLPHPVDLQVAQRGALVAQTDLLRHPVARPVAGDDRRLQAVQGQLLEGEPAQTTTASGV